MAVYVSSKKCNNPDCKVSFPKFNKEKKQPDGLCKRCVVCRRAEQTFYREKTKKLQDFGFGVCECGKEFKKKTYNQQYCTVRHQQFYGWKRQVDSLGGNVGKNTRARAVRKIRAINSKNHWKKYSDQDISILLNDSMSNKDKAIKLGRSLDAITEKVRDLRKKSIFKKST